MSLLIFSVKHNYYFEILPAIRPHVGVGNVGDGEVPTPHSPPTHLSSFVRPSQCGTRIVTVYICYTTAEYNTGERGHPRGAKTKQTLVQHN